MEEEVDLLERVRKLERERDLIKAYMLISICVVASLGKRLVYVGGAPSGDQFTGTTDAFHGVLVRGADGVTFMVSAPPEK